MSRFTLVYRGDIPPSGKAADKAVLRAAFDRQLRQLWSTPSFAPFVGFFDKARSDRDDYVGVSYPGCDIEYIPLVSERLHARAELDINLYSAAHPTSGVFHSGDIDNRLKTLLDALRAPSNNPQERDADVTSSEDSRVFCLCSDDRLLTRVNVEIDQLLDVKFGSRESLAIIRVSVRTIKVTLSTLGFAG